MPVVVYAMQKRHVRPNFAAELIFGNTRETLCKHSWHQSASTFFFYFFFRDSESDKLNARQFHLGKLAIRILFSGK